MRGGAADALLLLLLPPLSVASAAAASPSNAVVGTTTGRVRGRCGADGSCAFLGVPYAAAPTGARRWRAPEPAPPWSGIRDARAAGSACMQTPEDAATPQSEDCLHLDVYRPAPAAAAANPGKVRARVAHDRAGPLDELADRGVERTGPGSPRLAAQPPPLLPVVVFFYGGGMLSGANSWYNLSTLANTERCVVIAPNYRLGPLGWLALAELSAEAESGTGAKGSSGDYGR